MIADFSIDAARGILSKKQSGRILTRDGFPVRLLAFDINSRYSIAGVVMLGDDEYVHQWTPEGKSDFRSYVRTNTDLVIAYDTD